MARILHPEVFRTPSSHPSPIGGGRRKPLNEDRHPEKVLLVSLSLTGLLVAVILLSIMVGSVETSATPFDLSFSIPFWGEKGSGGDRTGDHSLPPGSQGPSGRSGGGRALRLRSRLSGPPEKPSGRSLYSRSLQRCRRGCHHRHPPGIEHPFVGSPLASSLGALLTILAVFYFGRQDGKIHPNTLLLAGVIISSFLSALIMFFISVSQREELRTIIFWLMGDFSLPMWTIRMIFPYLFFGFFLLYFTPGS